MRIAQLVVVAVLAAEAIRLIKIPGVLPISLTLIFALFALFVWLDSIR